MMPTINAAIRSDFCMASDGRPELRELKKHNRDQQQLPHTDGMRKPAADVRRRFPPVSLVVAGKYRAHHGAGHRRPRIATPQVAANCAADQRAGNHRCAVNRVGVPVNYDTLPVPRGTGPMSMSMPGTTDMAVRRSVAMSCAMALAAMAVPMTMATMNPVANRSRFGIPSLPFKLMVAKRFMSLAGQSRRSPGKNAGRNENARNDQ
jgi:hypothetical protein